MTVVDDLGELRQQLSRGLCGCAYLTSAYPCTRCRNLQALRRIEASLKEAEIAEHLHHAAYADLNRENNALRGLIGRLRAASFYAMTTEEWDAAIDRALAEEGTG